MNNVTTALLGAGPGWLLLLKVTLVLLTACTLHLVATWSHPRWRVHFWRGTWMGVIVTAVASITLPAWDMSLPSITIKQAAVEAPVPPAPLRESLPVHPENGPEERIVSGHPLAPAEGTQAGTTPLTPKPAPSNAAGPRSLPLKSLLTTIWAMVALGLFARWTRNYLALTRLRRRSTSAPQALSSLAAGMAEKMRCPRRPVVLVSREVASPCTASVRNPVILLPNPDDPNMDAILAHEIAHLRSRDLAWLWFMDWLAIALWFHPLCWLMRRQHLFACEAASDAAAADAVKDPEGYSAALAQIALTVCGRNRPANVGVGMAKPSHIIKRLRLLKRRQADASPSPAPWKAGLTTILAVSMAAVAGTVQFSLADDRDENDGNVEESATAPVNTASPAKTAKPLTNRGPDLTPPVSIDENSPLIGIWRDERMNWHRFTPDGKHIEVKPSEKDTYFRTVETWGVSSEDPREIIVGLDAHLTWDATVPILHRLRPCREDLRLTKADPANEELQRQLATESPDDPADRQRIQGVWVARDGEYGVRGSGYETWVRFAPNGSFTKVHWNEKGYRAVSAYPPSFRLARFHGTWNLKNKLLDPLGASIRWWDDGSFIAQLKSYDESGIWGGRVHYQNPGNVIPKELGELLFADANEENRQLLLGTWRSPGDGGHTITFHNDGTWQSDDDGRTNGGQWEATATHVILNGFRIHRILRLEDTIYDYEVLPIDTKGGANPVRGTRHKVSKTAARAKMSSKPALAAKSFRGIDLTKAPATTRAGEPAEIWEARPPGSLSFEIREEVIVFPVGLEAVVYYLPRADRYYVQSDPLSSSTLTFYGAFQGNPFVTLKLADDLARQALGDHRAPESEFSQETVRARKLVQAFRTGEHSGLKRIGDEIAARLRTKSKK